MSESEKLSAILEELKKMSMALNEIVATVNMIANSQPSEKNLLKATEGRHAPDRRSIMNLRPALKEIWRGLEKCGGEATSRQVAEKIEKKGTTNESDYKLTNRYLNELLEIGLVTKRREKIGERYSMIFKAVVAGEEL